MSKKMLSLILGLLVVLLFGSIGASTEHYYIVAQGNTVDPPQQETIPGAEADYIMRYTVTWPTTWNPGVTDYNGHREIEVEDAPIQWKSYCADGDWEFDWPQNGYSDANSGTLHAYTHHFTPI